MDWHWPIAEVDRMEKWIMYCTAPWTVDRGSQLTMDWSASWSGSWTKRNQSVLDQIEPWTRSVDRSGLFTGMNCSSLWNGVDHSRDRGHGPEWILDQSECTAVECELEWTVYSELDWIGLWTELVMNWSKLSIRMDCSMGRVLQWTGVDRAVDWNVL